MHMQWFRWYHGTVDDRKWAVICRHSGQGRAVVIAVWCALLEHASQAGDRGSVAAFDSESLDVLLGIEDGGSDAVVRALVRKGLVRDGRIAAWERRQPRREDGNAAERQRRRRQRLALALPPARVAPADEEDAALCRARAPEEEVPVEPAGYGPCHAVSHAVARYAAPEREEEETYGENTPPFPPRVPEGAEEPEEEPEEDPAGKGAGKGAEDAPGSGPETWGDGGFRQLVAAYPADHVAPRAEAFDVWRRLGRGRPDLARLLQGVALWKASALWRKEEGRYIPKLANFLRRRMWEDRPPAPVDGWDAAEARQRAYRARMDALLRDVEPDAGGGR